MAYNHKLEKPAFDWLTDTEVEAVMPRRKPLTAMQALMEAAPHCEPVTSIEEMADLNEVVREAIEQLHPDDQLLVEAIVFERMSFRQLEERYGIGKSIVHRRYAAAILELRGLLIEHPLISDYLEGTAR